MLTSFSVSAPYLYHYFGLCPKCFCNYLFFHYQYSGGQSPQAGYVGIPTILVGPMLYERIRSKSSGPDGAPAKIRIDAGLDRHEEKVRIVHAFILPHLILFHGLRIYVYSYKVR